MCKLILAVFLTYGHLVCLGQSVERILEKHYEAHSQSVWDQVNTFSANVEWTGPYNLIIGEVLAKKPDLFYLVSQKSRVIEAYDGTESWTRAPWSKDQIQTMIDDRAVTLPMVMSFGSPIKKGATLKYEGKVQVDGLMCYWLVQSNERLKTEYFLSAKTNLFYKSIITTTMEEERENSLTRTVTKYRTFNGVVSPTVIEIKTSKTESEYVFDNILLGEGIATAKFKRPNG